MTLPINVNRSQSAPYSTGPSTAPATGSQTGRRTAPTTSHPLHTRGGGLPEGNMAPRASAPSFNRGQATFRGFARDSFANALHHAGEAINAWEQGHHHRVHQYANHFAAHQSQAYAPWSLNPGAHYTAANNYYAHQNYHEHAANHAFAGAANHAHAFFGHARQGIQHGIHEAAHATSSLINQFDPYRMAARAEHYGRKALHKAGRLAQASIGGLMLGGAAAAATAGHVAYHALNHASEFLHDVAQFDPYYLRDAYRPFR